MRRGDAKPRPDFTSSGEIIRHVLLRKGHLVVSFFGLSVGYILLEGVSLGLLIPLFRAMLQDETATVTTLRFGPFTIGGSLSGLLGAVFGVVVVKSGMDFIGRTRGSKLKEQIVAACREVVFQRLLAVELWAFQRESSGESANLILGEIGRAGLAVQSMMKLVVLVLVACVYGAFLLVMAPYVTVLLAVGFGLIYGVNALLFRRSREIGRWITAAREDLSVAVNECLQAMKLIRLYGRQADEEVRFQRVVNRNTEADYRSSQVFSGIQPLMQVCVTGLLIALILAARFILRVDFRSDAPVLLAYLFVLLRLFPLFSAIGAERSLYLMGHSGFVTLNKFLARTAGLRSREGGVSFGSLRRSIRFDHVGFRYPDGTFELQDITFTVPKRSRLGIVGPSGAGKSTLIDLLCGFHRASRGRILIDDAPLDDLDLGSWRRHLGVVSQETLLFNETVLFNVAYSNPQANHDEVIEACRRAYSHEFILALPQGYDTVIGEQGIRLSGGQRQRLSIARAFLSNPEVLILDEATSALDQESEKLIRQAVEELMEGKTVIVIAHRSSTIRGVDQILLLDQGRVVETGAHEELLARVPLYQRLYQ